MQVYKAFFKIIYKNLSQIMIYVFVFVFFAIILSKVYTNPTKAVFTESKINVAFINYDKNSKLVQGLKDYLGKNVNYIDISDNTQKLQDALFFRQVEYIIKVPSGFTDNLLSGKPVKLEKTTVPSSTSSILIDNVIDNYLNTAKTYNDNIKGLSTEQLISYINHDLSQKTDVKINNPNALKPKSDNCSYYYNYLAYSLSAILILGISSVMIVFNDTNLRKRNYCSPLKLRNINFQMILGTFSFAIISWIIMISASFIFYGGSMITKNGLLMILNSFIFTLTALSISFLIGNILNSKPAISAAANVISLGSCFISGVFVPQELLSKPVLKIASFTPTYWFVKSNNAIEDLTNFNTKNLLPIYNNMLVMIAFAAAILMITLVILKQKRMSN